MRTKKYSRMKKVVLGLILIAAVFVIGSTFHSLFLKDTADSKQLDKTAVVENETFKDIPKDDSTPKDYTPQENIAICQNVIKNMDQWTSKTEGTAVADVLFINYTQNISATKVIKDKSATQTSASESSLLSTGQQRVFKDDAILIRNAKKVKSLNDIDWEDDYTAISKDTYAQNYGRTPFSLTNYVINDRTITKAKTLKSDKGTYTYEFQLEPDKSTVYYKRQMRTEGGASDYPTFHSITATVTMDKQWRPLKIHYSENYDINISVVGSVTCQGEITETFSDFGKVNALPDQDKVDDFIKNKYDKNKLSDLPKKNNADADISSYVTDMFKENPYYSVDLKLDNQKIKLNMFVDLSNGVIKAQNKDIFLAYKDDYVYINYQNIKVRAKAKSIFQAIDIVSKAVDPKAKTLDLNKLTQIDINNIDEDSVSGLLNNVKLEQSDDNIDVKFVKDGINADISVSLKDKKVALNDAKININKDGIKLGADIKTTSVKKFKKLTGFNDISKCVTLLKPWINTVKAKGIKGKVYVKSSNIKLGANYKLAYDSLNLAVDTNVDGISVKAVLLNKYVYLKVDNIKIKCKLDNLDETIEKAFNLAGINLKKNKLVPKQITKAIKQIDSTDRDIASILSAVKSVDYKNNALVVKAKVAGTNHTLSLGKKYVQIKDKKDTVKITINKKYKKTPGFFVKKKSYVSCNTIIKALTKIDLYRLLNSTGIILDTNISAGKYNLKGIAKVCYDKNLSIKYTTNIDGVPITLIYKDKYVYASSGKVFVKGTSEKTYSLLKDVLKKAHVSLNNKNLTKAKSFEDAFDKLIGEYAGKLTIKDIIGNVKTFKYEKGYLIVKYKYSKNKVATIKLKDKTFDLKVAVADLDVNAKLTINKIYTKSAVINVNSEKYSNIEDILNIVEKFGLQELLTSTGIDTDVTLNVDGKTFNANVKANYGDKTQLKLTTVIESGKTKVPLYITLTDNKYYIDLANIHVTATSDNLKEILEKVFKEQNFDDIFAKDISSEISNVAGNMNIKDVLSNIKTFKATKDTLTVVYKVGGKDIALSIKDKTISVNGIVVNDKKLGIIVKINNTKEQSIKTDSSKYIEFEKAYNIINNIVNKAATSKSVSFDAKLNVSGNEINAKVVYDIENKAVNIKLSVLDTTVDITYIDDVAYVKSGNVYIKATKDQLKELLGDKISIDDIPAFDDITKKLDLSMLLNINNISCDDSLKVEYSDGNMSFNISLNEKSSDVTFNGVKINDNTLDGSINNIKLSDVSVVDKSEFDEKYVDFDKLKDFVLKWQKNPAFVVNANVTGKNAKVVLENKNVYIDFDGLKLKSDDGSVASIIDGIAKIYDVDVTPVFDFINITKDEDIDLSMFKIYADTDVNVPEMSIGELLNKVTVKENEISFEGKTDENTFKITMYDAENKSLAPNEAGYIDIGSMDTLLKSFGQTAGNFNFDITGKASLGLDLSIFKFNLKDVPLYAKLKVEKDGVYGKVHADVPYMSGITDANFDTPEKTKETTEQTSKNKTEVTISYKILSSGKQIYTDFFVTPEHIYEHKNVNYKIEKTVTTVKYRKIGLWIPYSTKSDKETIDESKDFYIKRTYEEMEQNVVDDLCFAFNFSDSIKDSINDSTDNQTPIEAVTLGNVFKGYSFENNSDFKFNLNLKDLTNDAIEDTNVTLTKNSEGYLNKLKVGCSLYSVLSIDLNADLTNIGQTVDIGFNPEEIKNDLNYAK